MLGGEEISLHEPLPEIRKIINPWTGYLSFVVSTNSIIAFLQYIIWLRRRFSLAVRLSYISNICFEIAPRSHASVASNGSPAEDDGGRSIATHNSLITYEALPEWCQDNPYVRAGYRPISNSYKMCAHSCAYAHNETMNILTHMIPAIILAVAQIFIQSAISQYFPEASMTDRVVIGANVLAAVITFTLSTVYHTFMSHSMEMSGFFLKLDFVGILTLILGSFFSGIYVGFYCEPGPRSVYWSMITILSLITAVLVVHPRLQGVKYRPHRTYAFVATALTGFAPISHGLFKYGWDEMWIRSGMPYWFLEGILYTMGAFFFITRVPESIWPGRFDFFTSHAIFHVLVVMASLVHLWGVWSSFAWNYENARSCQLVR